MGLDADDLFSCLEVLSTVAAGIFSGSAIYVNVVEHPARMTLTDTKSCHRQWMESFDRAKVFDQHKFSPNDIHASSKEKFMRITPFAVH